MDLPENPLEWLSVSDEELVMRRSAYWISLEGDEPSDNWYTVTVRIPAGHRFDPDSLGELLQESRARARPNKGEE